MKDKNLIDPINLLRVLAAFMVFCLHTSIFSGQRGFMFSRETWYLQTPAWGGVWIFFIISGYLIGKGFYSKKFTCTIRGILYFYGTRFLKIGLPTLGFVGLCCILVKPDFLPENPHVLIRILTFTYDSNPGFDGVGATWYVSTLMQLYLITPLIYFILDKISIKFSSSKKSSFIFGITFFVIVITGFICRQLALKNCWNWNREVYVPFYMNLDLYISGMLLNFILPPKREILNIKNHIKKILITVIYITFIFFNTYVYYKGYLIIYQYVFPSIYIGLTIAYLYIHESIDSGMLSKANSFCIQCVSTFINWFANISFGFYLFHSLT